MATKESPKIEELASNFFSRADSGRPALARRGDHDVGEDDSESRHRMSKKGGDVKRKFSEKKYIEQVNWESEHLCLASLKGGILFWLPRPVAFSDRPYAQTTRFELGEWKARMLFRKNPFPFIVGIEP